MISDLIYPSPPRRNLSRPLAIRHLAASSFIATVSRIARTEVERARDRASSLLSLSLFSFFFAPLADTLEIDDGRETRGYFWRETRFLI